MEDHINAAFSARGRQYSIDVSINGNDSFCIDLYDEETIERWSSDFSSTYIEEITKKAGMLKRLSVFWRMIQTAFSGTSNEVSYDILTSEDVANLQKRSHSKSKKPSDDKRYFIITQVTEFDKIHFPLSLKRNAFTCEELVELVKGLKKENKHLKKSAGSDKIQRLEAQIYDLNSAYDRMCEEKDTIIRDLQKHINSIQNTVYQTPRVPKIKTLISPRIRTLSADRPRRADNYRNTYSPRGNRSNSSGELRVVSRLSRGSGDSRLSTPQGKLAKYSSHGATNRNGTKNTPPKVAARRSRIQNETDEKLRKLRMIVSRKYK